MPTTVGDCCGWRVGPFDIIGAVDAGCQPRRLTCLPADANDIPASAWPDSARCQTNDSGRRAK